MAEPWDAHVVAMKKLKGCSYQSESNSWLTQVGPFSIVHILSGDLLRFLCRNLAGFFLTSHSELKDLNPRSKNEINLTVAKS